LNEIKKRMHFLLILSPGSLPRLENSKDWLKREIQQALDNQRNIVPVLTEKLKFRTVRPYLKGDLSEVQVFCKVPYPDLGDKRVWRRKVLKPTWYNYETALMFIQALGRSVRSEKEIATTYILDRCFEDFYFRNRRFFPSYIRETVENARRIKLCSAPDVKS